MDGPFMCIDPLANTDLHLLCNVENEIQESIKQVKKIAFFRLNEIIDE